MIFGARSPETPITTPISSIPEPLNSISMPSDQPYCGLREGVSGDLAPKVSVGQEIVRIDPRYFRPAEVETLLGDPSKAKIQLGWEPEITAQEMCKEMIVEDHKAARRIALLKDHDLELPVSIEN